MCGDAFDGAVDRQSCSLAMMSLSDDQYQHECQLNEQEGPVVLKTRHKISDTDARDTDRSLDLMALGACVGGLQMAHSDVLLLKAVAWTEHIAMESRRDLPLTRPRGKPPEPPKD